MSYAIKSPSKAKRVQNFQLPLVDIPQRRGDNPQTSNMKPRRLAAGTIAILCLISHGESNAEPLGKPVWDQVAQD
jgi:hypothetical protein